MKDKMYTSELFYLNGLISSCNVIIRWNLINFVDVACEEKEEVFSISLKAITSHFKCLLCGCNYA